MTTRDFVRAIREYRGFPNAKIETKPYSDGNRMSVIVSGTPKEFPLVTLTPGGRWDIPDVATFPENGTLTAFDAAVHADLLLAYVRSGRRGGRDKLYPHVLLTAPLGVPPSVLPKVESCPKYAPEVTPSAISRTSWNWRTPTAIRTYFDADGQMRALRFYSDFARKNDWSIGQKMDLYEAALCAYGSNVPADMAFKEFKKIYRLLVSEWQVFRPSSPSECWPGAADIRNN